MTDISLEEIKNENIDLVSSFHFLYGFCFSILVDFLKLLNDLQERIPVEEVFEQLKCSREGLSSEEGRQRLQLFGPNKLEEKKVSCKLMRDQTQIFFFSLLFDVLTFRTLSQITGK